MNTVQRQTIVAHAKALETEAILRAEASERAHREANPEGPAPAAYPRDALSAMAVLAVLHDAGIAANMCWGQAHVLIAAANPGQSDPQTEMKWISTTAHHHWVETIDDLIDLRPIERDVVEYVLPPEGRTTFEVPMFWFKKDHGERIYGASWNKQGDLPPGDIAARVAAFQTLKAEMGGALDDHVLPSVPALVTSHEQYDENGSDYWLRVNAIAQLKRP